MATKRYTDGTSDKTILTDGAFPSGLSFYDVFPNPDDLTETVARVETLDVSDVTLSSDGFYRTDLRIASPISSVECWSGVSKTGTEFDVIIYPADFGSASSRQMRVHPKTNKIDFSPAQILNGGFSTLYIHYNGTDTIPDSWTLGAIVEAIDWLRDNSGIVSVSSTLSYSAVAGQDLEIGTVYVNPSDGLVYMLNDVSDSNQIEGAGFVDQSYSIGETVEIIIQAQIDKPDNMPILPLSRDLYICNPPSATYGYFTYDGDPFSPLVADDCQKRIGFSIGGNKIFINFNSDWTVML